MHGEHADRQQGGLTQVVDEAPDVSKESRINTVNVSNLHSTVSRQSKQWDTRAGSMFFTICVLLITYFFFKNKQK